MSDPKTKRSDLQRLLVRLNACEDARIWAGEQATAQEAWENCERGDWLLWAAAKLGVDRKLVVLAACACAELALPYVKADEDRPRKAIETALAWCRGEATIKEVRAAAAAADAAADAAAAAKRYWWWRYWWWRWYVRPLWVLRRQVRWILGGMGKPSPWQPIIAMYGLGCLPIGYVKDEFVIYAPGPESK